jgi:hypothetical protein
VKKKMLLRTVLLASLVLNSGCLFTSSKPVSIEDISASKSHLFSEVPAHIQFRPRDTNPKCDDEGCYFSNADVEILLEDSYRAEDQIESLSNALRESVMEKNSLVRLLIECEYGRAVRDQTVESLEAQSTRNEIINIGKQVALGSICGLLLYR